MDPETGKLKTSIARLTIDRLKHLDVNARYMTADQQQRLTHNIKRDGGLTSLPLVWLMQGEDGTPAADPPIYLIVSGNHRVTSAKDAGIKDLDCIVIENWISPERRVEIQLAHNAVNGQDDLSVLEQLYEGLTLSGKEYSGLTDDLFKGLKDINMVGFSVDGPAYQEITLSFLPEDGQQFEEMLKRVGKNPKAAYLAARLDSFDILFDAIVRTKEQLNVQNNAVAIHMIAELALERLEQIANEPTTEPSQQPTDDITLVE